ADGDPSAPARAAPLRRGRVAAPDPAPPGAAGGRAVSPATRVEETALPCRCRGARQPDPLPLWAAALQRGARRAPVYADTALRPAARAGTDRKSTRLNSSHRTT